MSAGKGSSPRPYSIPADEFAARHEAIFGKREKKPYVPPPLPKEVMNQPPQLEGEHNGSVFPKL